MATEKRLMDADEFLKWIVKRFKCVPLVGSCDNDAENVKLLLSQAPTVDAVEVVHGRWVNIVDYGDGNCYGFCSACAAEQKAQSGTALKAFHRYCRWCGAKMDGDSHA